MAMTRAKTAMEPAKGTPSMARTPSWEANQPILAGARRPPARARETARRGNMGVTFESDGAVAGVRFVAVSTLPRP